MSVSLGTGLQITGLKATGSLASYQYCPVKLGSTAGTVKLAVAVSDLAIGILQNDPTDGQAAEIIGVGNSKGVLAASITKGTFLTPNSTGQLKAASSANDRIVGFALATSSSTAGEIHPIFVLPSNL